MRNVVRLRGGALLRLGLGLGDIGPPQAGRDLRDRILAGRGALGLGRRLRDGLGGRAGLGAGYASEHGAGLGEYAAPTGLRIGRRLVRFAGLAAQGLPCLRYGQGGGGELLGRGTRLRPRLDPRLRGRPSPCGSPPLPEAALRDAEDGLEALQKLGDAEGLGDEIGDLELPGLAAQAVVVQARLKHDGNAQAVDLEAPGQLDAVHVRQDDVDHHHIVVVGLGEPVGLFAEIGGPADMTVLGQRHFDALGHDLVVFHKKYAHGL